MRVVVAKAAPATVTNVVPAVVRAGVDLKGKRALRVRSRTGNDARMKSLQENLSIAVTAPMARRSQIAKEEDRLMTRHCVIADTD